MIDCWLLNYSVIIGIFIQIHRREKPIDKKGGYNISYIMYSGENLIGSPTMQNIFCCNIKLIFFQILSFLKYKTLFVRSNFSINS